ncbi:class D sortase [Bacillus horti]|uniref:Sortase A n=1 Tax=Caldalkalibacillus horti TaxID=77523 RepID=A0ABT9VTN5_9BACI|nr:class D sortase [Bacillus horti]MDQ0164349.1 sortase A [Bacillus horti]
MKRIKALIVGKKLFSRGPLGFLPILCLVVGIALILYPWVDQYVQSKEQSRLLSQWDALQRTLIAESLRSNDLEEQNVSEDEEDTPQFYDGAIDMDGFAVLGTIEINKIELREPIIEGVEERALKIGIGTVVEERFLGGNSNFVLAGHRSLTYGKQFNRMAELEEGDEIVITTTTDQFVYKVSSAFIVQEDDLSVLEQSDSLAELTLITCEYDRRNNPTQRLIVKAHLI